MVSVRNTSLIINFGGSSQVDQRNSVGPQPEHIELYARRTAEILREEIFQNIIHRYNTLRPQEEVAALPSYSNISPDASVLRAATKHALADNDIAKACRLIEQAEDIEARVEADALRRAERLQRDAQDACNFASAKSVSLAETQSAHAAILYELEGVSAVLCKLLP